MGGLVPWVGGMVVAGPGPPVGYLVVGGGVSSVGRGGGV